MTCLTLTHRAQAVEGPVGEDGFAIDKATRDDTPRAAVVGGTTVIAEDEVLVLTHPHLVHRSAITVVVGNVGFRQFLPVYKNAAPADLNCISGHSYDALDVGLAGVAGIPEYDRIESIDIREAKTVRKLVDKDALLIDKCGHHASAFHSHWLIEKQNNDQSDDDA